MEKNKIKLNLAVDSIAVYGDNNKPIIGTPPGWPGNRYYNQSYSIFHFTPEEIYKKFNIKFPLHWPNVSEKVRELTGHTIFPHNILAHFPDEYLNITLNTVDYFIERGEEFIYLIHIIDDTLFQQDTFKLNPKAVNQVKLGKAKVLVFFPAEGYINHIPPLEWLNELATLNELTKESLLFAHSNLTLNKAIAEAKKVGIEIKFTYYPLNYFEYNPWFIESPHQAQNRDRLMLRLDEFIQDNRKKTFRKHFNILNRRPHLHRIYTYSEIKTVPILDKTSEISLGIEHIMNKEHILSSFEGTANDFPEFEPNYEFIKKEYDITKSIELDVDLNENRAGEFTRDFYKNTFCSLTVETAVNINQMFFSEKAFKPIFNLQPFLLYGNQGSIKQLQKLGYKTFGEYWDESYDEVSDYRLRLKKISSTMQEIASWSESKLYDITQELEPILVHNFYVFMYNRRFYNFTKKIGSKKLPTKSLI